MTQQNNRNEVGKYERIEKTMLEHLEQNKTELCSMEEYDDVQNRIDEIINHCIDQNDMYTSELIDLQTVADEWLQNVGISKKYTEYRVGVSYEATGVMFIRAQSPDEAEEIALKRMEDTGDEYIDIHTDRKWSTLGTNS
jgi:elongation factor P--beta-lysine ligase